ncbi:MAG TPA: M28 family peptidase [Candidatus Kapabacteria bacterium]|nr:M28 family peptidase [Candidatus Kapabacteria bacterium]
MIKIHLLILLFLSTSICRSVEYNSDIQNIIDEVNIDSLRIYVEELTGEKEVLINGEKHKILTRYCRSYGNDLAADYLADRLESFGLKSKRQDFQRVNDSSLFSNIYAIQKGKTYPNEYYVIGSHYDSITYPRDSATGADDNASGCAAVLEAARILSKYELDYSVIYSFFDAEEIGLNGSGSFSYNLKENNKVVKCAISPDMIGFNQNNDNRMQVRTTHLNKSEEYSEIMKEINNLYNIGLTIISDWYYKSEIYARSDFYSFFLRDIPALGIFEDLSSENNIYYHSISDSIKYFNMDYFHKNSKLIIASLATFVNNTLMSVSENVSNTNEINYSINPNPAVNYISVNTSSDFIDSNYEIVDIYSNKLLSGKMSNHSSINISGLASGMYFIILKDSKEKQKAIKFVKIY